MLLASALALSACGGQPEDAAPPPTEVSVLEVAPGALAIADELPGRVIAFRVAEIRPQVGGIIQRRMFEQGSEVRAGQPLFQINPSTFQADANTAAASLRRSQATYNRAQTQANRLKPLVEADAISRQSYDDAVAARNEAAADVAQNQASLQRRRIDVGYATVRSPISGRIDQANMTEGALATAGDAAPLATVQQIDRVYVDVRQPASRLEMLRRIAQSGQGNQGAPVEILGSDGTPYPVTGRMLFSGISVDPGTGEVVARVEVPNPQRALLPGMFVRAKLPREARSNALTVPLQAVQHGAKGQAMVTVVEKGQPVQKPVTTGAEIDGRIVIESGIKAGDKVIVEGLDRLRPGVKIKPVAWKNPAAAQKR
jgi:multidrug efflux system membrane fusion protein